MTADERYAGRSVLVTGAQGFVGAWMAERLLDSGARVVALRRDVDPESRFHTNGIEERCVVAQADLLDNEALIRVLNEHAVSAVFHLAAQTIVGTAKRSPLSTFETNVRGTYLLLEACRTIGVVGNPVAEIVVASSDKAYGDHDELPYREDFALQPRTRPTRPSTPTWRSPPPSRTRRCAGAPGTPAGAPRWRCARSWTG